VNTKTSLNAGFKSYKSDSVDYYLEHAVSYPITLILFYDSEIFLDSITKMLAAKLLDVFIYKYQKRF